MSLFFILIWWYLDQRSILENNFSPCSSSISSLIQGICYRLFIVFLFTSQYSMQILSLLSLFFTKTTEEAQGLEIGLTRPKSRSYLMVFSISSLNLFGCLQGQGWIFMGSVPNSSSILCSMPWSSGLPCSRFKKNPYVCVTTFPCIWYGRKH